MTPDLPRHLTHVDELEVEELIRHYAPEEAPMSSPFTRVGVHIVAAVPATYTGLVTGFLILGDDFEQSPIYWLILVAFWAVGAVCAEWFLRRGQAREALRLKADLASGKVHLAIAEKFRREVQAHRSRTLGPTSEWARARHPLEVAGDEANRSVAYWNQRLAMEPHSEVAASQLETAQRLASKFSGAIAEIDSRTEVLRTFFNECEAKLALLEHRKRDYEETIRLSRLSDRADEVIENAEETLAAIGEQFIAEAVRVARALGGLERLKLLEQAGEAPVEGLEAIADQILASSEQERAALEELVGGIEGPREAGEPSGQ